MKKDFFINLKFEMQRLFRTKAFILAIAIGFLICLPENIRQAVIMLRAEAAEVSPGAYYDVITAYQLWAGSHYAWSTGQTLFLYLSPLLASMPYALSYLHERKTGYYRQVLVRTKKTDYYKAKYVAVFLSGGAALAAPLFLNFCITVLYAPLIKVELFSLYSVSTNNYLSVLFFRHPFIFVLVFLLHNFLYGGFMATTCLAVSVFTDFLPMAWAFPLILSVMVRYVASAFAAWGWDPSFYMLAGRMLKDGLGPMLTEFIFLGAISWLIFVAAGKHRDIY